MIKGTIPLSVPLGKIPYTVEKQVKFYVIRAESSYNAIMERPAMANFQDIISIPHLKLKFPTEK